MVIIIWGRYVFDRPSEKEKSIYIIIDISKLLYQN